MNKVEYTEYSTFNPAMYEKIGRERIARQIISLLKIHLSKKGIKLKDCILLDIGCSSGIMTNFYASKTKKIYAIDVDKKALEYAKKKYKSKKIVFKKASATKTGYKKNSFDIVIANQIYMWIDQNKMSKEIYKILKPGGVCFLGARNKYTLWDAQYYLPLIAFLPKFIADKYVKIFNKADSYESKYLSYSKLNKIYSKKFIVHKYTPLVMNDPKKYGYNKLAKYQKILNFFPSEVWSFAEPALPNFIWILEKPLS